MKVISLRRLSEHERHRRVTEVIVPTLRVVPDPRVGRYGKVESIGWVLPIDDASFRIYVAGRVTETGQLARMKSMPGGKRWQDMTEAEHRQYPGDYEAQVGQGTVSFHSEEHFATSDKGVALLRRFLEQQINAVAAGANPAGTAFNETDGYVRSEAGNYLEQE